MFIIEETPDDAARDRAELLQAREELAKARDVATLLQHVNENLIVTATRQQELTESAEQAGATMDIAPDGIARFDREFRYTYANAMALTLAGCPQATAVGCTNEELGLPRPFCER